MSFEGPSIIKRQGGMGRSNPSVDGVFLLIYPIASVDKPVGIDHNKIYELSQIETAEELGLDAAFDANYLLLVHHNISEFFRLSPEGKLLFMAVAPSSPYAILQNVEVLNAIKANEEVKGIGIAGTSQTVNDLHGMAEDVQGQIAALAGDKKLIDFVILQGNGETTPVPIDNYPDFREKNAPNVSVSIAQDRIVAGLDPAYAKYADVGGVLGMLSVRKVNENLGSVDIISKPRSKRGGENYPLSGERKWQSVGLSDGKTYESLTAANKSMLTAKGYIFAGYFVSYPGVYFNNAPTSVELASDYAYIENNRIWNKAARAVRYKLIPKIRSVVKKDPSTGFMLATSIAALEGLCNAALNTLLTADEISGYDTYIDPTQIVDDFNPLQVKISVVKDGIIHEMDIDLGYSATV